MNPRIKQILEIKPFIVSVKWSDGTTSVVDFNAFLQAEWKKKHPLFSKLHDEKTYLKAKTDGRTLYWEDLTTMYDEKGNLISAPLDFCPDVLYQFSKGQLKPDA